MLIGKEQEIFEIRVKESKDLGYAHGEVVRMAGERAYFDGFEEFRFAIDCRYLIADEDGMPWSDVDTGSLFYEQAWFVTELRTGMQVCFPQDTRDEALAEAKRILDMKGPEAVRTAIIKGLEMVGAA